MRRLADFPPGLAVVPLIVATAVAGLAVAARPAAGRADLVVWTFAQTHADALRSPDARGRTPLDLYEERTGRTVAVRVIDPAATDLRLTALLRPGAGVRPPDVVQLEIGRAARFLERPGGGLLPLDPTPGRFLPGRLATWTAADGRVLGLPADVHPVALAFRQDLWSAAGLDPTTAGTWDELAAMMRRYRDFHGRAALEFALGGSDHLTLLLRQRGFDPSRDGLTDPVVAETVRFAAGLLAEDLARPTARGHGRWARDLAEERVGMLWMPDWRAAYLRAIAPDLAGRVRLMPLPRFDAGNPPTVTWGGTMLSVPATAADPAAAADLALFLAGDPAVLAARARTTSIVPPLVDPPAAPNDPYFAGPEPFANLAAVASHETPSTRGRVVAGHLAMLLPGVVADARAGRDPRLAARLAAAQADVRRRDRRPYAGP